MPRSAASSDGGDVRPAKRRRRLLVLLHGARIYDQLVREALEDLATREDVTVRVTWAAGDVERFVTEAALLEGASRYDTIVAGGGDGSLNELVAALLRPPGSALLAGGATSVAQLPLGTANDLAAATGISLDPREALALAADPAAARPVDVASVNGEVFLNLATAGPVSEVTSSGMSDAAKKALGPAAIVASTLRHLFVSGVRPAPGVTVTYPLTASARPPPAAAAGPSQSGEEAAPAAAPAGDGQAAAAAEIEPAGESDAGAGMGLLEGKFLDAASEGGGVGRLRGPLLALVVGQSRQMGRMINICPDALLDDGMLDVTMAFGSPGQQAARLASDVAARGVDAARGGLLTARVPWLLVEAPAHLKTNRDGEPTADSTRLLFQVQPRAIRLHLPDDRLLLSGLREVDRAAAVKPVTPTAPTARRPKQLLRRLLRAQQPPGRLRRWLAGAQRLAAGAAWAAAWAAVGFWAGAHHGREGGQAVGAA